MLRQRDAAPIADRILMYGICVPVATRLRGNVISSMRDAAPIADRILMYGICVPIAARLRENVISGMRVAAYRVIGFKNINKGSNALNQTEAILLLNKNQEVIL